MEWQPAPYTAPLLVASLASFAFAAYAVWNRSKREAPLLRSFVGVTVASGVWSLAYAGQLSATTLSATLSWNRLVWVGIAMLAVAWPAFVFAYVGWVSWLRPRRLLLLCLVPATVVGGVFLVGADPLFYTSPALDGANGYLVMEYAPTSALIGFMTYSYAVNLFTFGVLGYAALARDGVFRWQAVLLLVAGVAPMSVGVVGISGALGPRFVDLTPVTFAATSGLLGWVVFRYRLLDLSPIARDAVFTNLSDGVVVVDGDDRVVDMNRPARGLFPGATIGCDVEEAFARAPAVVDLASSGSGDGDREGGDPASGTGPDEDLRVTIDGGSEPRFLTVAAHSIAPTGSGFGPVLRSGPESEAAPSAPGGSGDGTVLLFRDITERETLQRRYRALIEKSPNVIAVCGTDGLLRYVSPSIERLLGHAPAEIEGRPVIDLVHPDDRREAQAAFERAFETDDQQLLDHRIAHANGNWRQFETTVERLFEDTQEVVITATDVTESRRYEQRLQVLNRVLRHDLKNDTNVIGGYADLLRDHVDADGDEYLDVIDRKVETLTHLSDQAREIDVALHSDGARTEIDLSPLVTRLCGSLESSFPETTVTVSTPDSAVVCADELLESAVRNVLENAVVHNDGDQPIVEVSVDRDGEGFRVAVADNGPGIPPVERSVFSEARETALEHASGLGLWLVHWIVTESGGELEIHTREPTGTLVTMWFPTPDGASAAGDEEPAGDGGFAGDGEFADNGESADGVASTNDGAKSTANREPAETRPRGVDGDAGREPGSDPRRRRDGG
ncbi:PAS domain-containing sensor histidine kinase [Halorubrum salipaludis]|uniref:histidine kinase n=1 Tax=Halorubrum salipaludis TaxID=2032630 RepID=A0A2A2FFF7_9EURY|nr:histidine kinase N-terminal 7TM domain-containing protein [Halorubrum salipaludis]PAU83295.1 PAS domain-containing sensor histidine kinase [Halorubrum salipaludis]